MPKTKKEKKDLQSYYEAVGRRKNAIAQVRLFVSSKTDVTISGISVKKGDMIVNSHQIDKYFPGEVFQKMYMEPFKITNTVGRFTVSALIAGGGLSGQLGAFVHGVSRALEIADKEKFRPILKKREFLTRDSRVKERRKAGYAQKARARKQSPKR